MIQVKLFNNEKRLNDWLKENDKEIRVLSITFNRTMGNEYEYTDYLVVYEMR